TTRAASALATPGSSSAAPGTSMLRSSRRGARLVIDPSFGQLGASCTNVLSKGTLWSTQSTGSTIEFLQSDRSAYQRLANRGLSKAVGATWLPQSISQRPRASPDNPGVGRGSPVNPGSHAREPCHVQSCGHVRLRPL